jgi:predicted transposase/invertase (TIGR01784 family)
MRIDPRIDFAFKRLFGSEANKSILISLLRAVLKIDIADVQLLNPFNEKDLIDDKVSILDVKARLVDGTLINIEMQMVLKAPYPERALYYWARLYSDQLKQGDDYDQLAQTVAIHFINDVLFADVPEYHLEFDIRSRQHETLILTDRFSMHVLELPKMRSSVEEIATGLDQWCSFLNHAAEWEPDSLPVTITDVAIRRAMEELKVMFQTDHEREVYEGRMKQARDTLMAENRYRKMAEREAAAIAREQAAVAAALAAEKAGLAASEERYRQGQMEGRVKVLQESVLALLEVKFGSQAMRLSNRIGTMHDETKLREWIKTVKSVQSLEEFENVLDQG